MKNKTVAGIMALIAGYMGLHHFYLGQTGRAIAYIFFIPPLIFMGLWPVLFIGVVEGISLLSMDERAFDEKYNKQLSRSPRQQEPVLRRQPPVRTNSNSNSNRYAALLKSGKEKFKDYDYTGAIADFDEVLKQDPRNIAAHFNLACAHSLMENKDRSFYHLDRAVALGFDDFETIKTRDHLAFIRIQPEFLTFQDNGYRLAAQSKAPSEQPSDKISVSEREMPDGNLLEQLQKLAQLREKGVLTEEEFRLQKEKLLR
ncbi:MAG: NINE protein [Saprospiraceae bacterium]